MRLPAGYASRPAGWDDLDAIVALSKACDLVDAGVEDPVREHIEDDWRVPGVDLERQTSLVLARDGSVAAYANVFGLNPHLSVEAWVRVHPAHRGRGIGGSAIDWTQERARELVPAGAASKLYNSVPSTDEAARRLLADRDYRQVRIFWHMERELSGTIEPARPPEGIELRTYRHEEDADAYFDAIEEAFADHWGFEPYPREVHMDEILRYDRDLLWLALDGVEIAGGLMAKTVEGRGWVDMVAVRRPWRGRGIARSMLLTSFAALAGRGLGSVALNVDSESRTGATRLYESVGMHVRRAWDLFERPL